VEVGENFNISPESAESTEDVLELPVIQEFSPPAEGQVELAGAEGG